jgi:hypothetical protein
MRAIDLRLARLEERFGRPGKRHLVFDDGTGSFDLAEKERELRGQGFASGDEVVVVS